MGRLGGARCVWAQRVKRQRWDGFERPVLGHRKCDRPQLIGLAVKGCGKGSCGGNTGPGEASVGLIRA